MVEREVSERDLLLKGKIAVVTGGASGIGKAIVDKFLREGAMVAIIDNDLNKGPETALQLSGLGTVFFQAADISKQHEVKRAFDVILASFGIPDILVNNAGITQKPTPITEMSLRLLKATLDTDLIGAFLCTQAFLRAKKLQSYHPDSSVIFLSSIQAERSSSGYAAYDIAKKGLEALSGTVVNEGGPLHVRSNIISPGAISNTGMSFMEPEDVRRISSITPLGRVGQPPDIASVALFLASNLSEFMTGQKVVVDGGLFQVNQLRMPVRY